MIEVIKTNTSGIPVGMQFTLDEDGRYSSYEIHEDVGDDYEFTRSSLFGFSPSFYELNKEIFNQVKLEETDEKYEINEGAESPSTEDEDKDLHDQDETDNGVVSNGTDCMSEDNVRTEMEEGIETRKSARYSDDQRSKELEYREGREEDNRIDRLAAIESNKKLRELMTSFNDVWTAYWKEFKDRAQLGFDFKNYI